MSSPKRKRRPDLILQGGRAPGGQELPTPASQPTPPAPPARGGRPAEYGERHTLTLRVPPTLRAQLGQRALATDRSVNWHACRAIELYLAAAWPPPPPPPPPSTPPPACHLAAHALLSDPCPTCGHAYATHRVTDGVCTACHPPSSASPANPAAPAPPLAKLGPGQPLRRPEQPTSQPATPNEAQRGGGSASCQL